MKKTVSFLLAAVIAAVILLPGCGAYPAGTVTVKLDDETVLRTCLSTNDCTISYPKEGKKTAPRMSISYPNPGDPFVQLLFSYYLNAKKIKPVSYDKYPYLVLKVKGEGLTDNNFELYFNTNDQYFPNLACHGNAWFDNTDGKWTYVLFDLTGAKDVASGNYSFFRFDFVFRALSEGEAMTISEIIFAKDLKTAEKICGADMKADDPFTKAETKKLKTILTADGEVPGEYKNYKPKKAENEDSSLGMYFMHTFTRTVEEDKTIKKKGAATYLISLAKNEAEDCQLILSADKTLEGLTLETDGFSNGAGATLITEILEGYYFEVEGENIIDPVWPNAEPFSVEAGKTKSFVIKVTAGKDAAAGFYKATVNLKDSAGRVIKTADVFCRVWDFELPDETSCKTLMDLSWYNIYMYHEKYEGDEGLLYKLYYDYLLENRVCSYNLPYYSEDGTFSNPEVREYVENPRVVAFQPLGFKGTITAETATAAYNYLSQNPAWLEKAYFYPVDEPADTGMLDSIKRSADVLKENFPGYKLIAPTHLNFALDSESKTDFFEYLKGSVTAWCPHTFFFNTWSEYSRNPRLYMRMTPKLEANLGTFRDRMKAEQEAGNEVWWYVTRVPSEPEITLIINTDAVRYRELFWQQKLYGVDGFLYYMSNDWAFREYNYGVDPKHETQDGVFDVCGNGVLVYCGKPFGIYGPVGSLRLECVRDGIEDYEYLTILEKLIGGDDTTTVIRSITTSLSDYNEDPDELYARRTAIGNLIEKLSKAA
ncbi:MAG: DUF4091 domain-containing protein [Clostridia bacterium]|nr:DUF4091 domain-containing protein [Clostridia bacterium]